MPSLSFVQVEVKKAEPRDSKAPGQLGPGHWAPRGILSAANGWTAQPAQSWQQPYGPQGEWEHVQDQSQCVQKRPCSCCDSVFNHLLSREPCASLVALRVSCACLNCVIVLVML